MDNLKDILEEMGVPSDKIDEIVIATSSDKKEKVETIQVEDLDSAIDAEKDPFKKAGLVARKISKKLEHAQY